MPESLIQTEPKCHCCIHPMRQVLDQMLVAGYSYSEIERQFANTEDPVSRKSLANHAKEHMKYQDAAIRNIVEARAKEALKNVETEKRRILTKQAYLDLMLEKGWDDLVEGNAILPVKDILKGIEIQDRFEKDNAAVMIERFQQQLQLFMQAVQEIVPPDLWGQILSRTKELIGDDEEIVDADPIDEAKGLDSGS